MAKSRQLALMLLCVTACSVARAADEMSHWQSEAAHVTIVRDDWGIAHVHGHTDADAVFGMIYAQCEDDFNRVEMNFLTSLGRTAEAEGEAKIWQDLRQRLFIDPVELQRQYAASPAWLRALMDAWADGANFYLAKHPEVHAKVLTHFEPWMALSFSEGSIGGDIERVDLKKLEAFYGSDAHASLSSQQQDLIAEAMVRDARIEREPSGSNGVAIAPANTVDHHALLLINPHTSFFFRSELQMTSDQGLDAYGAVTWGQFFIYQGFNDRAGWMHTSSGVDAVDEFVDTLYPPVKGGGGREADYAYHYGNAGRLFTHKNISIRYTTADGVKERTFLAYYDHRGPITHMQDGKWVSMALMNLPTKALEQSFLRTKARNYADYKKTMELFANSSNNTIFADADGDIAYWHGNYIPRRNTAYDYTKPVDGSTPDTDWHGLLTLDEVPHLLDPKSGFLFNVNNAPWWGAGVSSLKKADYPAYVEMGVESARGLHAIRLFQQPDGMGRTGFTLDGLLTAAFDGYLPWFDKPLPALFKAYDSLPADAPSRTKLHEQIELLRGWDQRWSKQPDAGAQAEATSLAIFWGEEVRRGMALSARQAGVPLEEFAARPEAGPVLIATLAVASDKLAADFGNWRTPWGTINRFQRLTGDIVQPFNDVGPSYPVPFVSSVWGSLASFGAHAYPGTKKWYGTSGNSFVAVVEFGDKVRARAVTAGGESGHPGNKHFDDEVARYASGDFREVYFYPDQLKGHTERTYHPGS
jgi:acyl-homoserine-lactone acylase